MRNASRSTLLVPAAFAGLCMLLACSQKPAHTDSTETRDTQTTHTTVQTRTTPRDTVLRDTTRVLGTPGSPTGAESRGMPGEKPVPGTKKPVKK